MTSPTTYRWAVNLTEPTVSLVHLWRDGRTACGWEPLWQKLSNPYPDERKCRRCARFEYAAGDDVWRGES